MNIPKAETVISSLEDSESIRADIQVAYRALSEAGLVKASKSSKATLSADSVPFYHRVVYLWLSDISFHVADRYGRPSRELIPHLGHVIELKETRTLPSKVHLPTNNLQNVWKGSHLQAESFPAQALV